MHGLFGKLLAKKKELKKSCRAGEITSYSTEYSTQCDDAVRWNEIFSDRKFSLREVCSNEYEEECEDKQVSRLGTPFIFLSYISEINNNNKNCKTCQDSNLVGLIDVLNCKRNHTQY